MGLRRNSVDHDRAVQVSRNIVFKPAERPVQSHTTKLTSWRTERDMLGTVSEIHWPEEKVDWTAADDVEVDR